VRVATPDFLIELRKQNRSQLARINILYSGNIVASGLGVVSGTVRRDRTRSPRGSCNLVLAEPFNIPTPEGGVLSPLGYEVQVFCGTEIRGIQPYIAYSGLLTDDVWVPLTDSDGRYIMRDDGGAMFVSGKEAREELLSLGIFPIQISQTRWSTLLTTVNSIDRTQWLLDDVLESDLQWPDSLGGSLEANVERLIRTCPALSDPEVVPCIFSGTAHSPAVITHPIDTPKWRIIEQAASAIGYEAYFDGQGIFRWGPSPNLRGEVAWELTVGEGGDLIDGESTLDRGPAYSKVIAVGSNADSTTVYRGEVVNNNPLSPTRHGSGFSNKQKVIRSSMYTSDADAQAAAQAVYDDVEGIAYSFVFDSMPNELLEEGDIVQVTYDRANVIEEVAIIDAITYSLSVEDSMSIDGRAREEVDS
jgi:hypothetical protein